MHKKLMYFFETDKIQKNKVATKYEATGDADLRLFQKINTMLEKVIKLFMYL